MRFQLRAGFVIPAVLLSGVNSEVPGSIIAQVAQDVYDNATGTDLLMPQGARLIGSYSANVQYGVLVQIVLSVCFLSGEKTLQILSGQDSGPNVRSAGCFSS